MLSPEGGLWERYLKNAALVAKCNNAKMLALATHRFVRHPLFVPDSAYCDLRARDCELEVLRKWTDDVPLVTLIDPDATNREVHSHMVKFGWEVAGDRGGRPKNAPGTLAQLKESLRPKALELKGQGMSLRDIAKVIKIPFTTVGDWLRSSE